jgi:tellurite resistance protein TerC
MTPVETILVILQLIFLEGILSIDNAAVLGAMVSVLPTDKPIPWPRQLSFMPRWGQRYLGNQRSAALKVGLLGAYAGRALMLVLASFVIHNVWLKMIGAAYLFKLSLSHLSANKDNHADEAAAAREKTKAEPAFWHVVLLVELADLAFSIDNVVAAVALSDRLWVVMIGVALGIVTMRFAAQLFTVMIEREPILAPAAYILVLNISLELLIEEIGTFSGTEIVFADWQKFVVSLSTLVLAIAYSHFALFRKIVGPILRIISQMFAVINQTIDYLFFPFIWLITKLLSFFALKFRSADEDEQQE